MNAVGWCFVEASIKNSFRTPRCVDKMVKRIVMSSRGT